MSKATEAADKAADFITGRGTNEQKFAAIGDALKTIAAATSSSSSTTTKKATTKKATAKKATAKKS